MKSVHFIGILIILLLTVGTAGADVVLTEKSNQLSILVSVNDNEGNSTITFLDRSTEVNNQGITGIAYNLNVDAQLITGYKKGSNTGVVLFSSNSDNKDGYAWKKTTSGKYGNLPRFYSGDAGRFQKVVVKLSNYKGNIPSDDSGNQVGVQYLCDQFSGFIAGPAGIAVSTSTDTTKENSATTTTKENSATTTTTKENSATTTTKENSATTTTTKENSAITTTKENPAIDLEIKALSESFNTEGQKLQYGFVISNVGNVAISELKVTDSKFGTISFPSNALNPGQIISVTNVYTVSKDDIDVGSVTNSAYASGKYKSNIIQSTNAIVTVKADNKKSTTNTDSTGSDNYKSGNSNDIKSTVSFNKPALAYKVSASPKNYSEKGQKIEFKYFVTNTGSVPIKDIKVTDNYLGTVSILKTSLEPGNSISATSVYTVTQKDLDLGKVKSVSHATGRFNGNEISSEIVSLEIKADTAIPEFPSMILPVAAILGLLFLSQHKRKEK